VALIVKYVELYLTHVAKKDFVQQKWGFPIALMLTNSNVDVIQTFIIFKLFSL
jgi:hypothetical protein